MNEGTCDLACLFDFAGYCEFVFASNLKFDLEVVVVVFWLSDCLGLYFLMGAYD